MPAHSKPTTYVALLRGVNLGSRSRLAMADLRAVLEDLGATDVRTYLQSGNAVFRSDRKGADLATGIAGGIRRSVGLDIAVMVRTEKQLRDLVAKNPFAGPKADPKTLHVTFLGAKPDAKRVRELRGGSFEPERFELVGRDVYLETPNGYGRAKLNNATLERRLGVAATTRNWRTATALAELAAPAG